MFNDPPQFLSHYYHFVAELFLGTWAFLFGAFHASSDPTASLFPNSIPAALYQPSFNFYSNSTSQLPLITRTIFIHASADTWRDAPGFNAYFLRAAFPSMSLEVSSDWADRASATYANPGSGEEDQGRAWHFPLAMLADRSAAHRGDACGSRTQRTASEPWELMVKQGSLDLAGLWWGGVRGAVLRFAGLNVKDVPVIAQGPKEKSENSQFSLPMPKKVVIVYITRQGVRRSLIKEDHDGLVIALEQMIDRKKREGIDWELMVVQAETLTKDEQVRLAGKATVRWLCLEISQHLTAIFQILLGVHGNGLTHLVFMQPSRISAVIEIFFPGGFSRDYEWTTRALGMRHFSVWNDTWVLFIAARRSPSSSWFTSYGTLFIDILRIQTSLIWHTPTDSRGH